MSRKSENCCREFVQNPTYPSAVGSMDGVSTDGARNACCGSSGLPFMSRFIDSEKFVNTMFAVSSIDRSMCSPLPRLASAEHGRQGRDGAKRPRRPLGDAALRRRMGSFPIRPRIPIEPDSAWSVNSVAWRSAHGPVSP